MSTRELTSRVHCMSCSASEERVEAASLGWLIDERPTVGGNPISVVLCFPCRTKTTDETRESCGGKCNGSYHQPGGWRAACTWIGHCDDSWSCWDEQCVRDWAAEHGDGGECVTCHQETDHSVEITRVQQRGAA